MCDGWEDSDGPLDPTDFFSAPQYLYCQLKAGVQADVAALQEAWDTARTANQDELAMKNEEIATLKAQQEQQLQMLNCPVPIVPYADVTGDYTTGLEITCHPGYELDGAHPHTIHRSLAWV